MGFTDELKFLHAEPRAPVVETRRWMVGDRGRAVDCSRTRCARLSMSPQPPLTALRDLDAQLESAGFAVLEARALAEAVGVEQASFERWTPAWEDLVLDEYLRDGGRYRRRRFGAFVVTGEDLEHVPQRPHWQSLDYNALHGGLERWFEPLPGELAEDPAWRLLLVELGRRASRLRGEQPWFCEAHPFRIEATEGIGRPTPEGAHRDGVDLVALLLVARLNVKGGETRVFDARGPQGMRFTINQPWSALLLDDERVIHESSPIQPLEVGLPAYRDTLVITLRAGGFQGPAEGEPR